VAYDKLNELTPTKYLGSPTLIQIHCMMMDLYPELGLDIRELYEVLASPMSGFQCIHHPQHGIIVDVRSPMPFPSMSSPTPSPHPLQGNPPLFGGMN
jgi:hypothetical protein